MYLQNSIRIENLLQNNSFDFKRKLVGSIIKGPIDGATLKLKDANGKLIASTIPQKGVFSFHEQNFTSDYYTIESVGGTYDDKTMKTLAKIGFPQGLSTLLSTAKLQAILKNNESIIITPETTIFTALVINNINNGMKIESAIAEAYTLVTSAMTKNSRDILTL